MTTTSERREPMSASRRHTVTLVRREDGRESSVFDVTGWSAHNFDKMWDGLVMKVDFATWMPVYSPERGGDQTIEDWLSCAER